MGMTMKALLTLPICLLALLLRAVPNPSFQSFTTNDFKTNGYIIALSPAISNQWNVDATNAANSIVNQSITQNVSTIGATLDGARILSSGFANGADTYLLDFQLTNGTGQKLIYRTIAATNNCRLIVTNAQTWGLLSLNIIASNINTLVLFPYPLPHLDTNGLTLFTTNSITNYSLTLSNGNELRLSLQSNAVTMSSLWQTFGQ